MKLTERNLICLPVALDWLIFKKKYFEYLCFVELLADNLTASKMLQYYVSTVLCSIP